MNELKEIEKHIINRLKESLDFETYNQAVKDIEKAKSLSKKHDLASLYTNLNFYRFEDNEEIVEHAGCRPKKTKSGRDSKTKIVYFIGDREYEKESETPKIYFDRELAIPFIEKILSE